MKTLLSPDPAESAAAADPNLDPSKPPETAAAPPAAPKTASPLPAPPIVAQTALNGPVHEREAALEKELKLKERRVAELEDENRTLKTPPPAPLGSVPAKKKGWLEGNTFFD